MIPVFSTLHSQDDTSMKWYRLRLKSIIMSCQWHSQRQGSFDAIRLTWIAIGTKKKRSRKEEEYKKNKEEYKNVTIDSML